MALTPSEELRQQLYHNLTHSNILRVSPVSPLESFDVDIEDFPNVYYIYRVTYNLNLNFPPNKQDLFTDILNPTYYGKEFEEEALVLWRKIAVGFDFTAGEKTHKTFEIILEDFSVSQIYSIIWKTVADASKLYL